MAAQWYEHNGYDVIDRNWRCREGEIDLVMRRRDEIIFCEVKTRSSNAYGTPAASVTKTKQLRLRKLALLWLAANRIRSRSLRFDVACVVGSEITVIEAAF